MCICMIIVLQIVEDIEERFSNEGEELLELVQTLLAVD